MVSFIVNYSTSLTHTHTHKHTHTHTHTHTQTHTHKHTQSHTYLKLSIYTIVHIKVTISTYKMCLMSLLYISDALITNNASFITHVAIHALMILSVYVYHSIYVHIYKTIYMKLLFLYHLIFSFSLN